LPSIDCGHGVPVVARTFNSGNGQKSIFSLCDDCKIKECFNEFVIEEKSFDRLTKFKKMGEIQN